MRGKIFISYRREDSQWMAGRLYDRLLKYFSAEQIFIDVDSIAPGEDFEAYIKDYVKKSDVLLAIIGSNWLESIRSRLNENDFVRLEISAAFENNVRIIPILLGNTAMPSADHLPENLKTLPKKNAFTINHQSFNSDIEKLANNIKKYFDEKGTSADLKRKSSPGFFPSRQKKKILIAAFIITVVLAGLAYLLLKNKEGSSPGNRLNIISINTQHPLMIVDMAKSYAVMAADGQSVSMPMSPYALLAIFENSDKSNSHLYYYQLKSKISREINFKTEGNKLYADDNLVSMDLSEDNVNLPDGPEINSIETIVINTKISDSAFDSLRQIIKTNPHISIIDRADDNRMPVLIRETVPEILYCNTDFKNLSRLNLSAVKSAVIIGSDSTDPHFYQYLTLPELKNLVIEHAATNKILEKNSAESITCINDTTLTDISVFKYRDNLRQLEIFDHEKGKPLLSFKELKSYKNLLSFGHYREKRPTSVSGISGMISLNIHNVNSENIEQLALNNPDLEELSISFSDKIRNFDWAASFKKLRSLSIEDFSSDSTYLRSVDAGAIKQLSHLECFSIKSKIDQNSTLYNTIREACPQCKINTWALVPEGFCLGSGWLLLLIPGFIIFFMIKGKDRKKKEMLKEPV